MNQGRPRTASFAETMDRAWQVLAALPRRELTMLPAKLIDAYYPGEAIREPAAASPCPPGRAGRLWLVRRLAVARRGADLLDRKHRILLAEPARLRDAAARTAAEWDRCCADAGRWLLRASLLGGERAIRLAADGSAADVTISYGITMGVRHPDSATCRIPGPRPGTARRWPRRGRPTAARSRRRSGTPRRPGRSGPSKPRRSPPGPGSAPSGTAGFPAWSGRWPR